MGKIAQISQTSKSNVILLKEEGYKNKKIASSLGLSEAFVSQILKRKKKCYFVSDEKEWSALQNDIKDGPKNPEAFESKPFLDIERFKKVSS